MVSSSDTTVFLVVGVPIFVVIPKVVVVTFDVATEVVADEGCVASFNSGVTVVDGGLLVVVVVGFFLLFQHTTLVFPKYTSYHLPA